MLRDEEMSVCKSAQMKTCSVYELENHLFSVFKRIDFDLRTSRSNHYRLIEKPRLTLRIIQCESWTIFNGVLDMRNCTRGSNLWSSVCLLHMWLISCQGQTLWLQEEEFRAVYWDAMEDIFHCIQLCCFHSLVFVTSYFSLSQRSDTMMRKAAVC